MIEEKRCFGITVCFTRAYFTVEVRAFGVSFGITVERCVHVPTVTHLSALTSKQQVIDFHCFRWFPMLSYVSDVF